MHLRSRLRRGLLLLACAAIAGIFGAWKSASLPATPSQDFTDPIAGVFVDAGRGPVAVHLPDDYDPKQPAPLVLLLHGFASSGQETEDLIGFLPLANHWDFIYLHPDGSVDLDGNRFWNATDACCDLHGSGIDDSGYLRGLIETVEAQFAVDSKRIYVVGFSNGGFMAHRMACDHADKIAAIASLSGSTHDDALDCSPTAPVHVLQVHGTMDGTILYGGDPGRYPGAVETIERWAAFGGCTLVPDTSAPPVDMDASLPGRETLIARYENSCELGGSAQLWTIVEGVHVLDPASSAGHLIVRFLYDHPGAPQVGTAHCFGDGSGTPCPCGNESVASGEGCRHSGDGGGMLIAGGGSASVTIDDLVLTATQCPPSNGGLFFAGTVSLAPGNVFADGLQCAGGSVRRFRSRFQSSGTVSDTDFGAQAGVYFLAGTTYQFQYWTRDVDAGTSPCGGFSNLSPAFAVTMQP